MGRPSIEVILACQCMTNHASRIDWSPGEYTEITPKEASKRMRDHVKRHRKEAA